MVRAQIVRIGERFEIARALLKAVKELTWKRRFWTLLAALGLLAASVSSVLTALATLVHFAEILSPPIFARLFQFGLVLGAILVVLSLWVGVSWLLKERMNLVVRAIDEIFGGETFRNALDLTELRDDDPFVSPQFARIAIAMAWRKWQDAKGEGVVSSLTALHRKRTFAILPPALTLLALAFWSIHLGQLSVLLELYRDAQKFWAFERHGKLVLSVIWGGNQKSGEAVVLKGSSVFARVKASSNLPLPQRLEVWLIRQGDGKVERLRMNRIGDGEFGARITVSENCILRAVSSKVKSNLVKLQVVGVPRISEWLITVEPPDYSNLPPETFSLSKWQPLTVLRGSKVTLLGRATEALVEVHPKFDGSSLSAPNPNFSVEDRTIRWTGVILKPFRVKLRLVDKFGFSGETEGLTIKIRPDNPPKVLVLANSDSAMAGGFAPLTVRAEDDFGVSELTLQFDLSEEKQIPLSPRSIPLDIVPSPQVEQALVLPIPAHAAGKILWVRAIARDNDAVFGAKSSVSKWLTIRIRKPEEFAGTIQEWLERLKAWEDWLQRGEWTKTREELSRWLQRWRELIQQAQWSETPLPHQWLANWLSHWQGHLRQKDLESALQELWQMQRMLERSIAEEKLAELAQRASALRAQQETICYALRHHARLSSLEASQRRVAELTGEFVEELGKEARHWEQLNEPSVAFALRDVLRILEDRPTEQVMRQAQRSMKQELREIALLRAQEALTDLREAEKRLTSSTQSPFAQLYRRERNLLAQLLEQTERLRRDQKALREETEKSLLSLGQSTSAPSKPATTDFSIPPSPPAWEEVEKLSGKPEATFGELQRSLVERQEQLLRQAESMRRPLSEAIQAVPQLPPYAFHHFQEATAQMSRAAEALRQGTSELIRQRTVRHQQSAEDSLRRLAENLRQVLKVDRGTITQQVGAGENEAMALARQQAQILRETQILHRQQLKGQTLSQKKSRQLGAEEGSIRHALGRTEGFFGDVLPPELRQRVYQSLQHLQWLERNLPQGKLDGDSQRRQQYVLETLLRLAEVLSGQQGNRQGQQRIYRGQIPSYPDINWGQFVEHGPPMRQVPEALQGSKGGASFVEPAKGTSIPPKQLTILRPSILPAYRDAVLRYWRQVK